MGVKFSEICQENKKMEIKYDISLALAINVLFFF